MIWTPFRVYLTALSYTTALVIFAGTVLVQCAGDWSRIRQRPNSTAPQPRPTNILHSTGGVKSPLALGKDRGFANSSPVTGREWTPSSGTLRSDRGQEPGMSLQGVRSVSGREPNRSLRFTETGQGHFSSLPATCRAAKSESADLSQTRTAATCGEIVGTVRVFPDRRDITVPPKDPMLVGAGTSLLVRAAADLCGVDRGLAWSLALRESSGRHWGRDGNVLRSSSNALGLFQIKLATARDVSPDLDIMQPWGNALAGLCHFRRLLDKAKGDERLALRWYHRGEWAKGPVPQATHDYINDIMEAAND